MFVLAAACGPLTAGDDADRVSSDLVVTDEDPDFFERRVRPLLVERCHECHAAAFKKSHGGLTLDRRDSMMRGGDSGPAVSLEDPDNSLMIKAIGYQDTALQMPPTGRLPDGEIAVLTEWVRRGLPFPSTGDGPTRPKAIDLEAGKRHWAFQPLTASPPGEVSDPDWADWPRGRIDHLVLEHQLRNGDHPLPAASRRELLRRAKFDLLGLPPTLEEVVSFAGDAAPDAFEKRLDAYLGSPRYGERWGRYWLDLARYCDIPEQWRLGDAKSWLYRDWVVQALNADMSYPDFVRRQFAADLLSDTSPPDHAALGFLGLSPVYWKELKLDHVVIQHVVAEEWEERIEAIGSTFLGMTLACARCHDHKFDPVTTRDYYALAGVLASIRLDETPIIPENLASVARKGREEIKELEKAIEKLVKDDPGTDEQKMEVAQLRERITTIRRDTPHLDTPLAYGVSEASMHVLPDGLHRTKIDYRPNESQDVAVQIRGNPGQTGETVPRRFLSVLARDPASTFRRGSGRLDLADAIVTDAAPLAARVIVNRVWQHHFGEGLVATPSNFGTQGEPPRHPELLDDLAFRFVEQGWSLKWLHREIMLSRTYQQRSRVERREARLDEEDSDSRAADRTNGLGSPVAEARPAFLVGMPLRRLDVEAWRDAMLAATGELNLRMGGEPEPVDSGCVRRTIYCTVKRRELSEMLRLHDFPDPVAHSERRQPTTTPLQQLFVLNSPFMRARSEALVMRLDSEDVRDIEPRVRRMYGLLFAREPASDEIELAADFLAASLAQSAVESEAWKQYAQALLGSNEMLFVE